MDKDDNIYDGPDREPSVSHYFNRFLARLDEDQPLVGGELVELLRNIMVRARTIWTYQELVPLLVVTLQQVETAIHDGKIIMQDDDGEYPVLLAENKRDPDLASMHEALEHGIPDIPADWFTQEEE